MVVRSDRLSGLWAVMQEAALDLTAAGENGGYSLLDHMRQCADLLSRWRPGDPELAIAGLVHDIGHVLEPEPDRLEDRHGQVAAAFLEPLFGSRIATIVELHVPAKRYLVAVNDTYGAGLSPASGLSLAHQGGSMGLEEQRGFESHFAAAEAVTLRRADDAAKVAGREVGGLEEWWPRLEALVSDF